MKEKFIRKDFHSNSLSQILVINEILDEYKAQGFDLSLRQLYYQLVVKNYIPNTKGSYKNLGNLLRNARLAGLVDWSMIVDRSRSQIIQPYWRNPKDILDDVVSWFQINPWENQPVHMEVMIEKDALSGILIPVTRQQGIYFTATIGYPSISILHRMSKRLLRYLDEGKDIYILHMADHDPSGIDMTRDLADRLEMFTGFPVTVERLALTSTQIERYDPPENPVKLKDTRANTYIEEYGYSSWELDALDPKVLAELVNNFVDGHRDEDLWQESLEKEDEMRKSLDTFVSTWKEEKS